jgi:nucleoside permease NupC
MKTLLSFVMMPLVFLMGVPWEDCKIVGEVVGLKKKQFLHTIY